MKYNITLGSAHGFKFPNGTYDGLFGMLQREEVDTLFFPYPLNELVMADFHAVPVFRYDPVCILSGVRRLYVDDDFAIATTFDSSVWLAIFVSWIVTTAVTVLLYHFEPSLASSRSRKTFTRQLFSYLQVLLMEGTSMDLRRASVRSAFLGWSLGSILLANLINGTVKGSLVVQTPAARIDSVADVMRLRPPPTPYTLKTGFLEKALQESPRAEFRAMHALMVSKGSFLVNYMDMVSPRAFDALMAGTGVQISTEVAIVEHYRAACSSSGRRFHIAREPILEMMLTWYSSRSLPTCFLRQMELRTMWLTESGLPFYRRERFLSKIRSCVLSPCSGGAISCGQRDKRRSRGLPEPTTQDILVHYSEVQEHEALSVRDVKAAFYMPLALVAAAMVAFAAELLVAARCREVLASSQKVPGSATRRGRKEAWNHRNRATAPSVTGNASRVVVHLENII
ncbi:uncharacterized protein LOC125757836 [Rhipicephalus sanguineus]|uniref:uncharacterized protein LOC125757836 n=1 Tax=Rhipicephalus sanguineus TaxID=34632 RepID=UPI0020C1FAC9|nr:uncharacterized protein LOC125757836 [Rhipicephalus sanguineus]